MVEWETVDPDQKPCSATSDMGLHCLLRPICSCSLLRLPVFALYLQILNITDIIQENRGRSHNTK